MRVSYAIFAVSAAVLTLAPAAVAAPYAGNLGTATYQGVAKYTTGYTAEWDDVACEKSANLPSLPKGNIAALNLAQYGSEHSSSVNCGVVVQVTGPKGTVKVQIVDAVGGQKKGDLILSKDAFAKIGTVGNGIEKITWSVAP
ncbi:hypothetical protein AB5J62_05900 [Amycolatopsis sp. cg5]|uniref:hypothetical protein n=1 Tax=Amycolatopsis sp. cg5 TaxID=3238802 RepID=UPI003525DE7F